MAADAGHARHPGGRRRRAAGPAAVTDDDRRLSAWLRSHEVHVLHVIGHGDYDDGSAGGRPLLPGPVRPQRRRPARRFSAPTCTTTTRCGWSSSTPASPAGSARPTRSAAWPSGLVQQDCTAVVAMQFPISDGAATAFTGEFYAALADGMPVDQAVTSARKGLLAGYASEWATPVLYLNAPDGQVFEGVAPRSPEATRIPVAGRTAPDPPPTTPAPPLRAHLGRAGARRPRDRRGRRRDPRRGGRARGDPGRVGRVARGGTRLPPAHRRPPRRRPPPPGGVAPPAVATAT